VRLRSTAGDFVVKPTGPGEDMDLSARAAAALGAAGLRAQVPLRSKTGLLVSESGFCVLGYLPGQVCLRPSRTQTMATMRYLAGYHAALADVPVPGAAAGAGTIWTQVASAEYLIQRLPGLFDRFGPRTGGQRLVATALGQVETSLPLIRTLRRQLVHGDIGPDNVLMDADEVVAVIDFTPHFQPALFAVATAAYWYCVHGRAEPDVDLIWSGLDAAAPAGGWSDVEQAVWPSMLLIEALRRLATPLALAERNETAAETELAAPVDAGARYEAVAALVHSWPRLSQSRR
jgi:Ser/Thr protein kinase RdoA (MazF antagonist)